MFSIYEDAKKVKEEWEKTQVRFGAMIDKMRAKLMEGGFADDTHDKVYELNKQMCDIDKTILTKKEDIMEKKTKKMTKAEAFEYLKGKKVKCYKVGEHYGEELLKKLAECGCTSNIFLRKGILSVWAIFISDVCDLSILDTAHADQYGNYDLCEISADDILSIEIVEEEEDTSMPTVEFERYVKILQAWSKRINSSFVFSERGMGIVRGDLLTKLEGEEKGAYYKMETTL